MMDNSTITDRPVLVTGGFGFIGSHLVHRLVQGGRSVVVLTRKGDDTRKIQDVLSSVEVVYDDMSDAARLKEIIRDMHPIGIFHCAALVTTSGIAAPEDELIKTHIYGTFHLLKALEAIDYDFFIHLGTCVEYGTKERPLGENDICEPVEMYAITKLAATLSCQAFAKSTGKPIVVFRLFTPYGPHMHPRSLAYEVISRAIHNEEILLSKPEINRDFVFIDDVIELLIEGAKKAPSLAGEIFNVGNGTAVTLKKFIENVMRITESSSNVRWGGAREARHDRGFWQANMEKTFQKFSWRPTHDLDTGILKMEEWLSSQKELG